MLRAKIELSRIFVLMRNEYPSRFYHGQWPFQILAFLLEHPFFWCVWFFMAISNFWMRFYQNPIFFVFLVFHGRFEILDVFLPEPAISVVSGFSESRILRVF